MSILETVEEQGYVVTIDQVREYLALGAGASNISKKIKGGYFKMLCASAQAQGNVTKAHELLYPIVKEEYEEPWMDAEQRNKATNFARSAYSTLKQYEKHFGAHTISTLQSKEWYRDKVKEHTAVPVTWEQRWGSALRVVDHLIVEGTPTQQAEAMRTLGSRC